MSKFLLLERWSTSIILYFTICDAKTYEPFAESLQIVTYSYCYTHTFSWRFHLQDQVKTTVGGGIIIADYEVEEHKGYAMQV